MEGYTDEFAKLRRAGISEYQSGHYLEAEVLLRKAIESALTTNDQYGTALSYSALADLFQAENRFSEADQSYRQALSLLGEEQKWSHAAAIVWRNRAAGLAADARFREASSALKQASSLMKKSKANDSGLAAEIQNTLGIIQFHQGEVDKAEVSLWQAARLSMNTTDPLSMVAWDVLNNIGHIYHQKHEFEKAEDSYKRSLRLAISRFGESNPNVAVIKSNLGSLYSDTGRYKDAEDMFQQTLSIFEQAQGSINDVQVMRVLYELGKNCIREHNEARAESFLSRSVGIARKRVAAAELPEVAEIFDTYSRVLKSLSNSREAEQVDAEARRVRASMAFTVRVAN
jgi:tetratricopeptide (TPR) repeat protein